MGMFDPSQVPAFQPDDDLPGVFVGLPMLLPEPATRGDLEALRAEVRALREALPVQSTVILTGRDVVDAMRQLRARGG